MRMNYVLIDFENVQPRDLDLLREGSFHVRVFLGPHQPKIPVALAASLQPLGAHAEYVLLEAAGPNALDLHIAYYIGALSSEEPSAHFDIISKDTGFDPLIRHLRARKISAQRSASIGDIPRLKTRTPAGPAARIDVAIAHLKQRKASRPGTEKTLRGTLSTLFKKELSDQQLTQLVASLRQRGVVTLEGTKVSYSLPPGP